MKKAILDLFAIASLGGTNFHQPGLTDQEILRELNARFIHNFVTNDTFNHSKIIHKDFVHITSQGQYIKRDEYLRNWANGFRGYVYWDYRDERINIFGTTALVHATNKYLVRIDEKEFSGMTMYTDIYIKENGEWKCIQAQITKLSPEYYPGDETIVKKYDYR